MILQKNPTFNYYDPIDQVYEGDFANLAIFLTGDAFPIAYWMHFLESNDYQTVIGDSTRVTKAENNMIVISARWGFDDPDEDPMPFTIAADNFREVLNTWTQLLKQKVEEITITTDESDAVILEGRSGVTSISSESFHDTTSYH